jgi:hypothetical protein
MSAHFPQKHLHVPKTLFNRSTHQLESLGQMLPVFHTPPHANIPMPANTGSHPQFVTSFTSTLANGGAGIQPASAAEPDQIYQCSGCGVELHSQQAAWKHKTQCARYIETARNAPEKMPSMQQNLQQQQPAVQYLNDEGWIVQWFNEDKQRIWKIGVPQFKYCKKRKDHFNATFPDVWYKAPYKCKYLLCMY